MMIMLFLVASSTFTANQIDRIMIPIMLFLPMKEKIEHFAGMVIQSDYKHLIRYKKKKKDSW